MGDQLMTTSLASQSAQLPPLAEASPTVSAKETFLRKSSKYVTHDGLTCRIRKLKTGQYLDIVSDCSDEEGKLDEIKAAAQIFVAGVLEPEFTIDELREIDADVFVSFADSIRVYSGVEEAAAAAARKSATS